MEKLMSNKRKLVAGLLALSAGFVLASCDPVKSVPSSYSDPIVATEDGSIDLKGNNLGSIYNAISGDKNSKVVEKILTEIAEKQFGTYADFLGACNDASKKAEFISAHSDFFDGKTAEEKEDQFKDFKADIESRISEAFYNEITSGSYNDDLGRFDEQKLYNAHVYELYDLTKPAEFSKFFVDNSLTKETAANKLHIAAYQDVSPKRGYIQEKVYPDILRNKIVEDYIYRNNRSSLGRAYAREANYVKISYENEETFAPALIEAFGKKEIEVSGAYDFEHLVDAQKGFKKVANPNESLLAPLAADDEAAKLLVSTYKVADFAALGIAQGITIDFSGDDKATDYAYLGVQIIPEGTYYKETKLGKIIEEYQKAIKGEAQGRFPDEEYKTALESFTSDGKSKEYGLLQKVSSLIKEDYTTDGWYVKNGGLSELPSKIRDRLFNIRTANVLDSSEKLYAEDSVEKLGGYEAYYEARGDRNAYLRNIFGKKLVMNGQLSYAENPFNYIWNESNAYYIVEVKEAPSTAKLADTSTAYAEGIKKEEISRQVAKVLGTKDSYIKDAYTQYLNHYAFTFYDTSLYEYLKSEYPDLSQFND